ncbi:hypothetical protein HGO38_10410 [Rhizobium sp. CG5]|uniref:hypothetical protein n=1 Tax=Rhizobium sp. CG5 TaxID=2726076 RepID=UPI00203420CF|nr:hypothetical protein [Rhizobium sp. CG5]MCM2473884.1 hypothetical protein [Rhizobium sp. CG5]
MDRTLSLPDIGFLRRHLKAQPEKMSADTNSSLILNNQTAEAVGIHSNKNGLNVFKAMDRSPDIIILDNYFDLSARLFVHQKTRERLFFHKGYFDIKLDDWSMDEILPTKMSVENFHRIVDWFRTSARGARIYFINFPSNTYKDQPSRAARHLAFQEAFVRADIGIIPLMDVNPSFQADVPQHFKHHQYCAYAGIIKGLESSLSKVTA